ncbi:WD40 repeat [Trinorchestia longiramus]|nr:WD40 repeat [Trinorchestia longiramus]
MANVILRCAHQISSNYRHGNCIEFSSHSPNLVAVAANDNYGIKGKGELAVLSIEYNGGTATSMMGPKFSGRASLFPSTTAVTSLDWCHRIQHLILTGSSSGDLLLWNITKPQDVALVQCYSGPSKEVSSIAWSPTSAKPNFVTASWDGSLLLHDPGVKTPVCHVAQLPCLLYDVRWSPHMPDCFLAAAGDGTARVYQGGLAGITVPVRPGCDVLSCDWSHSQQHLIATAAADAALALWDLRYCQQPLAVMQGHEKAINRVRFSPHLPCTLATASYDFTTRVWQMDGPVLTSAVHSDFSFSVAWNPSLAGVLADCSWDSTLALYVV